MMVEIAESGRTGSPSLTPTQAAQLLAIRLGLNTIETGSRSRLDWHITRGLSHSSRKIDRVK
jgi:hypothetical protein